MEYVAFVFGIFGLMAYLQISSMKSRIDQLERELTRMKGTSFHEDRSSLLQAIRTYIGRPVKIEFKEDNEDADIISYGNSRYGSNTIREADEEWMLVHISSPKGEKDKLIRMESVRRVSVTDTEE